MKSLDEFINKAFEEAVKEETSKKVKDFLEQIISLLDSPNWTKEDISRRLKTIKEVML